MKANELMIGDWVQDLGPVVIDAISNEDVCTYRTENGYITANPSNLKPIPLTKEILEQNGFKHNVIPEICIDDYTLTDDYFDITINEWSESIWQVVFSHTEMSMPDEVALICFVHELQHVLRLCDLNDFADNFKVK